MLNRMKHFMRNTINELTFLYCKTYRNNSLMLIYIRVGYAFVWLVLHDKIAGIIQRFAIASQL